MIIEPQSPCDLLPWDTEFFGKKIGRVRALKLDRTGFGEISLWASRNSIDCLYLRFAADAEGTIQIAEEAGFRMVDIRVTLELNPARIMRPLDSSIQLRFATVADLPILRQIAAYSHVDSRFYADAHFPRDRCNALYETWIEKAVRNPADAVVVPLSEGRVSGYCACHLGEGGRGEIGLLAVAREAQGRGCGAAMIDRGLRWFQEKGCERVTVVTQGRNVPALRFYQKAGFLTRAMEVWFHRWFTA